MGSLPALAANATGTVMATLDIPLEPDGTKVTLQANVNPDCSLPEKACDGLNQQTFPLTITNQPDLTFGTVQVAPIQLGGSYTLDVPVVNNGGTAAAGWTLVANVAGQDVASIAGPSIPGLGNQHLSVTFTIPPGGTPPQDSTVPLTLTIAGVAKEVVTTNNVLSGTARLVDFALAFVPTGTQTGVLRITLAVPDSARGHVCESAGGTDGEWIPGFGNANRGGNEQRDGFRHRWRCHACRIGRRLH